MPVGTEELHKETHDALKRVQEFTVESLPREADLGRSLNFNEAVEPAEKLVELFKRLSLQALDDFPDQVLTQIRDSSNNVYRRLEQILSFDTNQSNPQTIRQSLISQVSGSYLGTFQTLHPYISYSLHRSADFQRLDTQARATLQAIEDKTSKFITKMEGQEGDAERILGQIRKVAAEEGVTQQASHFRAEADQHDTDAKSWQEKTVKTAWLVGLFAVASLFLHKIPFMKPESMYETIQLGISKILIFSVLTYILILSAKNFLSHRHNAIVNRHRQNALMTHRALVEGTNDPGARDAVMLQAASCIFAPQSTGYSSSDTQAGDGPATRSVVELLSKSSQ